MILIIAILGVVALLAYFWPRISYFLSTRIRHWVEEKFGTKVGENFAEFLVWLDKGFTPLTRVIKAGIDLIKTRLLRHETTYTQKDHSTAIAKTEIYLDIGKNQVIERTEEETLVWEDLPKEVRSEMICQNAKTSMLDNKEAILLKARERAREDGLELEMVH